MVKTRYKVDLARQHAQCEANYARLCKLMPGGRGEDFSFAVRVGGDLWKTGIRVVEISRYTTTVQLARTDNKALSPSWLTVPQLTVRLYHDARMAEVLAWERHRRIKPRYDYPNRAMYQSDEKAQINRFLGEWLALCLRYGQGQLAVQPLVGNS